MNVEVGQIWKFLSSASTHVYLVVDVRENRHHCAGPCATVINLCSGIRIEHARIAWLGQPDSYGWLRVT